MKFQSDIDIDFADRNKILSLLQHTPASIIRPGQSLEKHNTGVYFTNIPKDPLTGHCGLDYNSAEERGYIKLDFLNVSIYSQVTDEEQLIKLMQQTPPWNRLYEKAFYEQLIHIGNHYDILIKMPELIDSIEKLAMFLAIIRPAKRHLIGKSWHEVSLTIWEKPQDGYYFKHSHSIAYSHLVVVHMNLLTNFTN
jgi:hypothetical protein